MVHPVLHSLHMLASCLVQSLPVWGLPFTHLHTFAANTHVGSYVVVVAAVVGIDVVGVAIRVSRIIIEQSVCESVCPRVCACVCIGACVLCFVVYVCI